MGKTFALIALIGGCLLVFGTRVSHPQVQMPEPLIAVNVNAGLVHQGLSLTRLGVADIGDRYTIGGTFFGKGKKLPQQVTLNVVTSSGTKISKPADLHGAPLNNYAFLVFLPKDDGTVKLIDISP